MSETKVDSNKANSKGSLKKNLKTIKKLAKAQMTVYMIIGILMIILLILGIFIISNLTKNNNEKITSTEFSGIEQYVSECIKQKVQDVIPLQALQGGYLILSETAFVSNMTSMSYGFKDNSIVLPTKEMMANHLSHYVKEIIPECYDLKSFENQGYSFIQKGSPEYEIIINEEVILVDLKISLIVNKNEKSYSIENLLVKINSNLGKIHSQAEEIVKLIYSDPEYIDLTSLAMLEYKTSVLPYNDTVVIYSIDEDPEDDKSLLFMFASHHIPNQAPIFNIQTYYIISEGVLQNISLSAIDPERDSIEYWEDTSLFEINEDGFAEFTPEVPGVYNITVTARDEYFNEVNQEIIIEVMEKR